MDTQQHNQQDNERDTEVEINIVHSLISAFQLILLCFLILHIYS